MRKRGDLSSLGIWSQLLQKINEPMLSRCGTTLYENVKYLLSISLPFRVLIFLHHSLSRPLGKMDNSLMNMDRENFYIHEIHRSCTNYNVTSDILIIDPSCNYFTLRSPRLYIYIHPLKLLIDSITNSDMHPTLTKFYINIPEYFLGIYLMYVYTLQVKSLSSPVVWAIVEVSSFL